MSPVPLGRVGRPEPASSLAPIALLSGTPCVLGSNHPPHPSDEPSFRQRFKANV
ncbi:MAG: hypothetical protein QOK13_594 [Gaiellaceae bacterium]|nr:hypothetical protein [Gaiellaceae bacterium]